MTFASDAQRRWWFANHGPNATGSSDSSSSSGFPELSDEDILRLNEERIQTMKQMFPSLKLSDEDARAAYSDMQDFNRKYL